MERAILRTLAYADVFDYPLTSEELYRFLIADESCSYSDFEKVLLRVAANDKRIEKNKEHFFLEGRGKIVATRKRRESWNRKKSNFAEKVAGILRLIPWIKLIGLTGALAMNNAKEEDDIDLLIITVPNRLWLTRGLVVSFLRLARIYRRPGKIKNKICPNMLLDEKHLAMSKKERDLFSAHEVLQMKPLWQRGRTYQRFLKANQWYKEFLPNWKP